MKDIAFFDFDGTITTKDSLFLFLKYLAGPGKYYRNLLRVSPYLIQHKFGQINAQQAKNRLFTPFLRNRDTTEIRQLAQRFCDEKLPEYIRPKAMEKIRRHILQQHEVYIVTASCRLWVEPWAKAAGIEVIGTELEVMDKKFTGRIKGVNCNGEEKANRIRKTVKLEEYGEIYAYGDTSGDQAMFGLATQTFYKPFE